MPHLIRRSAIAMTLALAVTLMSTLVHAQTQGRGRGPQGPPDITGKWTGTWTSFNPAQPTAQPRELCKKLDAVVARAGEVWTATFEGDCGRPYAYKISLEGRLVGGVVMFKGTVDLGAQDGGVYDWVGRGTAGEFIGFYTSGYSTGYFNLKKVPAF
jgi:hypothetical protein